jgi:hypothetical protein
VTARAPRRLARFDTLLIALTLGFGLIVVLDGIRRVPLAWTYLLPFDLHYQFARYGLVMALLMAGLAVYIGIVRKGDVTPWFRRGVYIVFGTVLFQGAVGLLMYLNGTRPAQDVHLIYGAGALLALPFFMFVETTARKRPAMGSYIWGFTLLAGILLRGIMTGV